MDFIYLLLISSVIFLASRYVSAGTSWLNGAFSKVAKAGHVAGSRTREKFQIAVSNLTAKVSYH
jgi:hypothetical protein